MKKFIVVGFLSFNVFAQVPFTNFVANSDDAVVCNDTNTEPTTEDSNEWLGRTQLMVMFHAVGCAAVYNTQTEVCKKEIIQAGECTSYHYKWGTLRRKSQLCVPQGHGASHLWECGSANNGGHFSFDVNNGQKAGVSHVTFKESWDDSRDAPLLDKVDAKVSVK